MRVLVTGHLGYIGVEAASELRNEGHEIVGLDTGFFDECDFLAAPDPVPEIRVDLRDIEPAHLRGIDAVVHLAALSNDPLGDLHPAVTYDINEHASVRLARAAKQSGVSRFIFASSCSLYGAGGAALLDETSPFQPLTPYGESKIRVEKALSQLADHDFSPVYLRNATAYGVSRRLRADIVVNNLVGHAMTSGKVLLQSDGTPWRPLVHIRDIIAAISAALKAPREAIHDQAFNIGVHGENYQIRDIAALVVEEIPGAVIEFAPGASADTRNYRVDFRKAASGLPSFRPNWRLRDGIRELRDAYRAANLSTHDWASPRYFRLRTVKSLQERGVLNEALRRVF